MPATRIVPLLGVSRPAMASPIVALAGAGQPGQSDAFARGDLQADT